MEPPPTCPFILTDNEKEPTPHRPDFYLGVIGLPIE